MKLIASLLILMSTTCLAEYRVYQYYIKARHPASIDQEPYLVTSTLSPQSYLAYHGGSASITIDLLRTWMCYGDTSYKKTCEPPLLINNKTNEKVDIES